MLLTILILLLLIVVLFRYVFFPKTYSVASSYEFRFFIFFYVVCLLGFGVVVADVQQDLNWVLKSSTLEGFFWSKIIVAFFLSLMLLVFWLFDAAESCGARRGGFGTPVEVSSLDNGVAMLFILLGAGSTIVLMAVYGFPQLLLFSGMSGEELALARTAGLHNSTLVPSFIRRLLARDLTVYLSFIYWARLYLAPTAARLYRSRNKLIAYFLIFLAVYNVSFELSKSKLVEYLLFLVLIKYSVAYILFNKKPSLFKILLLGLLLLSILLVFFSLVHPEWELREVLSYFLSRLFVSQVSPFIYTVSAYDAGMQMGEPTDLALYVGEVFKLTDYTAPGQHLTSILFPDAYYSGQMNYLSTFLLADVLWMFGGWFVPVFSLYVLLLLRGWILLKARARPNDVFLGLSAFIFYGTNFMSAATPFVLSASVVLVFSAMLIAWGNCRIRIAGCA